MRIGRTAFGGAPQRPTFDPYAQDLGRLAELEMVPSVMRGLASSSHLVLGSCPSSSRSAERLGPCAVVVLLPLTEGIGSDERMDVRRP
jgi:hypothetical protein